MGAKACTNRTLSKAKAKRDIEVDIEEGDIESLRKHLKSYIGRQAGVDWDLNISEKISSKNGLTLSPLSLALIMGQVEIFKYLYEEAGAPLEETIATLAMTRRKPVDVICESGDVEMLKYFLPLHLEYSAEANRETTEVEESSLFTTKRSKLKGVKFMTPGRLAIQRACECGHLEVVRYLASYFASKTPPPDFDVHYWDENLGENCALVAVRVGSLDLITFLHKTCQASFRVLNRQRENAIQVLIVAAKRRPQPKFLHCLMYLVEEVGIDLTYNYEEALLTCNDESMVAYIEEQLGHKGIVVTKTELETEQASHPKHKESGLAQFEDRTITDILQDLKNDHDSFCSSIRRDSMEGSMMTANMSLDFYH
jgi:ankyrin repeat protein